MVMVSRTGFDSFQHWVKYFVTDERNEDEELITLFANKGTIVLQIAGEELTAYALSLSELVQVLDDLPPEKKTHWFSGDIAKAFPEKD